MAIMVSLLVIALVLVLILLYHSSLNSREPAPPPFEEMGLSHSVLRSKIGDIESAIYESLYQGRVPESGILFSAVEPRFEQGNHWEFTEILIKVAEKSSLDQLNGRVTRALDNLKPGVTHQSEAVAPSEIICHVFAQGFYTHRIKMRSNEGFQKRPSKLPRISIIIDDLGYDLEIVQRFLELDLQLSLSILPLAPHTDAIVKEGHKKNFELMLHLPMEPENFPGVNPGPGALFADMKNDEIRRIIDSHLQQVTGARGVNNHMGSHFTQNRNKMAVVLGALKKKNLFYIDSRTTKETVAFILAREMGVPTANRNVFLDNDLSPRALSFQMQRLMGMARTSGAAIGIGHPHEKTLELLKAYVPRVKSEFQVVRAAELAGE